MVSDYLRLVPSVSVSVGGPAGALTQVRIRGAEATQTLLFVEGIRANDPAAATNPASSCSNADLAAGSKCPRAPIRAMGLRSDRWRHCD